MSSLAKRQVQWSRGCWVRHLATAGLNYPPRGRGTHGAVWRGGQRPLAPGEEQQVRKDGDYKNTSRQLAPKRENRYCVWGSLRPCHSVTEEEPKGGHFIFSSCRKLNIEPREWERQRVTNTKRQNTVFGHIYSLSGCCKCMTVFCKTQIKLILKMHGVQPIQNSVQFYCMERNRQFFFYIFFIVKERRAILIFISILKSQMTRLVIYLFWRVKIFVSGTPWAWRL